MIVCENPHIDYRYQLYRNTPQCCRECCKLAWCDTDGFGDAWTSTAYYCELGLFLPIKKQECKQQIKDVGELAYLSRTGEIKANSIFRQKLHCNKCGWRGFVFDAEPDIDGDGNLGCPKCGNLLRQ